MGKSDVPDSFFVTLIVNVNAADSILGRAQAPAPTSSYLFAIAICNAFSGDASKIALWSLLQK